MKKMILTMLVLVSILNTNNCTPKKKGGFLDKLIPLALLGGGTGNGSNATGSNTGDGGNGSSNSTNISNSTGSLSYGSITAGATLTLDARNQVNYTPTISGAYTDFTISPTLPNGLSFDPKTGSITGTALNYSFLAVYIITTTGTNMNPFSFSFSLQIYERLVKTGQTQCWDQDGTEISCDGSGQDGENQKGLTKNFTDQHSIQSLLVIIPQRIMLLV